ncbi:putative defense protein Hdd11 isoform X2 [Rhinatrema bivittatum]|uniref:putative defense protein Hdd11 isoform X2 n=1 Tax=Rhinatrema bivittatum TaxID=194408 RepID=UPI00112D6995|nr:putative defense protein Hdd11 isoform X2 [Rhinatrema bivittatum]
MTYSNLKMTPPFCPILVLLGLSFPLCIFAYGNGRVEAACSNMEPQHGTTAQTSPAPYNITVNQLTCKEGDRITVTITGNPSTTTFEGFLLQVRSTSQGDKPLGSFVISNADAQTLTCTTASSALSHTSDTKKTSIQATWIVPRGIPSDIQMRATIAANKATYWTNVRGPRLTYNGTNSGANGGTNSGANSGSRTMNPAIYCGLFLLFALLK